MAEEDEVTESEDATPEERPFDEADRGKGGTNEFVPDHVLAGGRDFRVEGNDVSGYIGVDPEYQTYANEHDKPLLTDVERFNLTDQYDHLIGNADDEVEAAEGDEAAESAEETEEPETAAPVAERRDGDKPGGALLIAPSA